MICKFISLTFSFHFSCYICFSFILSFDLIIFLYISAIFPLLWCLCNFFYSVAKYWKSTISFCVLSPFSVFCCFYCFFRCLLVLLHHFLVFSPSLISIFSYLLLVFVFFYYLLFSAILLIYFVLLLCYLLIFAPCSFYKSLPSLLICSISHHSIWKSCLLCYILRYVMYYPLLIDTLGISCSNL